jgi:hypothetical protein
MTGQAVAPDPACSLSPVTVPANSASLLVTFAGNAKIRPNVRDGTALDLRQHTPGEAAGAQNTATGH